MFNGLRRSRLLDPVARNQWAVSNEADHLEHIYGAQAIEWVLQQISAAPRTARGRLYKVHDELARRRTIHPTRHH